ncbi:MAG: Polymer-forming cytoskeletal [Bryobacterales bacterium]|jgi:cytoskeletal protein CcmA (bactofilin family)|nr:Polymer-forming cytoskeletal [Bryobacterales bacterium]
MFGSNPKPDPTSTVSNGTHQTDYNPAPNRVSNGVSIKGDVKFGSELVIDGEVEGNITSSGKLVVGTHATVIGDIRVGFVTIQGSVDGNVVASERCALEAGANLHGDVESPRLAVDENASFVGSAKITTRKS